METTPSSANWMEFMKLKRPGVHRLASLQSIGAWIGCRPVLPVATRIGRAGKVSWSSTRPHRSTETRVFAEVAEVGRDLECLDFLQDQSPPRGGNRL